MEISTELTDYWFEPTEDESIRFKLKPLTQPQLASLIDTYDKNEDGVAARPSNLTLYRAGCLALDGGREIEGITINGKRARWPRDKAHIPQNLISVAGADVLIKALGLDAEADEKNL